MNQTSNAVLHDDPAAGEPAATETAPPRDRRRGWLVAAVVLLAFAVMPLLPLPVPVVLPGELSSPGSLQILGIGLVFAGLAVSYDVVFGYTGLLSLGHALFFSFGIYGTNLLMEKAELGFGTATLVAVVITGTVAALIGAISLRVRGIAFAMVTLAFAEALSFFLLSDPLRISGGEEGLPIVSAQLPDLLRGVVNVRYVFWLALVYAAIVLLASWFMVGSYAGRVWQAIRENEDRVELLGLIPFQFKLVAFTVGGTLAALGGSVYLVLVRGASPNTASADFTLALLIMVVLGGAGRLWGAALGGMIYGLLTLRLNAIGTSGVLASLPDWLERTLSEPLFVLGVLFVLLVLFAPGGVAEMAERVKRSMKAGT